ncbi:hypothetical protein GGS26DRAFT_530263 [Hypomontagnella submonticulosa]|nr:hypothetical protein GGS26DRAFT_530263 [Hypomontagnella submonticulosa]
MSGQGNTWTWTGTYSIGTCSIYAIHAINPTLTLKARGVLVRASLLVPISYCLLFVLRSYPYF